MMGPSTPPGVPPLGQDLLAKGIVGEYWQPDDAPSNPAAVPQVLFRVGEHVILQGCRAETRMHMQAHLAPADWMHHRRDLPKLPESDGIFQGPAHLQVQDKVPAPVVEAGHVPAMLPAAVEHKDLPQEILNPPVVILSLVGSHQ